MTCRRHVDNSMRNFQKVLQANIRELAITNKSRGALEAKQDLDGVWDGILAAINLHDPSDQLAAQIQPLVASPKAHYKGYEDRDYIDIGIRSQRGVSSLRCGTEGRRSDAEAIGKCSPGKSNWYARILAAKSEPDIVRQGFLVAQLQIAAYGYLTGQSRVRILYDERDESSSSAAPQRHQQATTESGRRVRWRKRAIKQRKAMRDAALPYDEFRDSDSLGHEYMATGVVFEDGRRFGAQAFATRQFQDSPDQLLDSPNEVGKALEALGFEVIELLLDRRWSGAASLRKLLKNGGNFIVRLTGPGPQEKAPKGRPRNARRLRRKKEEGSVEWNLEEEAERLWPEAQPVAGRANVLVAARHRAPFQGFETKMTVVVGYAPPKGYRFKPDEKLVYRRNMFPIFFCTNRPATQEWAEYTYNTYLQVRWGIETDIKETKAYEKLGSGPNFLSRTFTVQVSMLLQNFSTIVWLCGQRARFRHRFMKWTFDQIMAAYGAQEAAVCGWTTLPAPSQPPPTAG